MFRRVIVILFVLCLSNQAFALDKEELNLDFFSRFNDECLVYYINEALENNHSAKQATHRVEEYRQQMKSSLSRELPSFSVSANYLGIKVPQLDNFSLQKNAFILPFAANYEADLLLKNRDRTRSAKKSYEISKADEKTAYIALVTDVATVYTNVLQYDELINLAQEQVVISTKILESAEKKYARGSINSTQLNSSRENLESTKIKLQNLEKQRDVLLMQLAVLCGIPSGESATLKHGEISHFDYEGVIPECIDSDVIFARPDVIAAEKKLEKAKIDIRVARKEFLPNFNITGFWIFNSIAPGTFFSWESSLAGILAGATQDIFTGGRKIANLRFQKAKYEELFENYKQVDLEAVKEVNTALCFVKHDSQIEANTKQKLDYEVRNFDSVNKKYTRGVVSRPEYLAEFSSVVSLQSDAVSAKTQRLVNYFTLYKATGGKL